MSHKSRHNIHQHVYDQTMGAPALQQAPITSDLPVEIGKQQTHPSSKRLLTTYLIAQVHGMISTGAVQKYIHYQSPDTVSSVPITPTTLTSPLFTPVKLHNATHHHPA